ncbi:hypothetical protein PFICI_02543 [Pestalotiopsis fici W106-1]|uniref:Uncharacterized protein n=1 Tax=Pestalotiopsis fici (strain W106-1 / CGMCC3.15140) TaxID=1229662 RepID=W3XEI7_PESFW|nr:uncharacterized protein PFICI_02543 [Pestalotiopsis fici W106-1]ETS84518.1 hypothetical protein PFICI_02543 [Pestalotiopsis fici W106-1]
MVRRDKVDDIDLSIRFKYGVHSIFLFVDSNSQFSDIASELLEIIKERFPDGLKADREAPPVAVPDDSSSIEFAVLTVPSDPSQGWTPLRAAPDDKPLAKGLKDNQIVAFAFRDEDAEDVDEEGFQVAFPTYEEEEMEE